MAAGPGAGIPPPEVVGAALHQAKVKQPTLSLSSIFGVQFFSQGKRLVSQPKTRVVYIGFQVYIANILDL